MRRSVDFAASDGVQAEILLVMLFPHQTPAYERLVETAEIFYGAGWHSLPVRPRFSRLIVGPSGSGKTHVALCVAKHLQLPVYAVDATNWMPLGVNDRGAKPTWLDIVAFLRRNERGVIVVDEIEKIGRADSPANSTWMQFLRVEIFALLDRRLPGNLMIPDENGDAVSAENLGKEAELLRQRLAQGTMIIAAGAFQSIWESRGKSLIGFRADGHICSSEDTITHAQAAQVLATEIVNRFAAPVLVLRPLGLGDYETMMRQLASKLPAVMANDVQEIGRERLSAAAEGNLGVRWLEELIYAALARRRKPKKPRRDPRCDASDGRLDLASFVRDARV